MIAISATTTAMRIARNVSGPALFSPYLVAMNPVLQSTTKIAGAARAANFSMSLLICGLDCLNICYAAIAKHTRQHATCRMTKIENEETPWMFAPRMDLS